MISSIVHILAWIASLAVLLQMRLAEQPLYLMVLVLSSYVLWCFALLSRGGKPVEEDRVESGTATSPASQPEREYYENLFAHLQRNWMLLNADFVHCEAALKTARKTVEKSMDSATSTGLLAINSMFEAARTGDIGKGFVMVSKDLVAISDQSQTDIDKIKLTISKLSNAIENCMPALALPLETYQRKPATFPMKALEDLHTHIRLGQRDLANLGERYRRNPKLDVRWLQLGDAVRRLLNELTNVLYQMEIRLDDVLTDMRLMRLSVTLDNELVREINSRLEEKRSMEEQKDKNAM